MRVERWDITHDMRSMPHPMHPHGFQFIVTGRTNSPKQISGQAIELRERTPRDMGLLDTVLVWRGETVSVQIDFWQPFSGRQRYMFHCHNLEHEDQGMMIGFAVVDGSRRCPGTTPGNNRYETKVAALRPARCNTPANGRFRPGAVIRATSRRRRIRRSNTSRWAGRWPYRVAALRAT